MNTTQRLAELLKRLDQGQELEMPTDDILATFGIVGLLTSSDRTRIEEFASKFGCVFNYDEFGHYDPTFVRTNIDGRNS